MRSGQTRGRLETIGVVLLTLAFGTAVGGIASSSTMLGIVLAAGLVGLLVFLVVPDKRLLCLVAWVLIEPLSVDKILYTAPPIWAGLRGHEIILSAADLLIVVLAGVLLLERRPAGASRIVIDRRAKLFFALLVWGVVSYLVHLEIYRDPFVASGPLGILHLTRNLAFVIIIGSAIRERSDVVWIALSCMVVVAVEAGIVYLSYATGENYNFARLLGLTTTGLQTYSGSGEALVRASGTIGVSNQQALFQLMFGFLVVGLLVARNGYLRVAAPLAMGMSLVAILLTFSRTAWLGSIVGTAIVITILAVRRELKTKALVAGSVLVMAIAIVLGAFAQPIVDRLTRGDDGATGSRIRMIELAADLALQHPIIGVGPLEYAEAGLDLYPPGESDTVWLGPTEKGIVPPFGRIELATAYFPGLGRISVPLSVHNKFLLTAAELGLVGLVIWLMIFYDFFRDAVRSSRSVDPFLRYMGIAGIALCVIASIEMMLDQFADDKTLQLLLFPLVVSGAAARVAKRRDETFADPALTR